MKNSNQQKARPDLKACGNLANQILELKEYEQMLKELANLQITFDFDDGLTVNYAQFKA